MDMFEFLERVEGALLWHEFEMDEHLNNQAWYTANLMMASGNLKKGTDVFDLKKGLYKSLEDREDEAIPAEVKLAQRKRDAEIEKAKLMKRFNLDQGISN